MRPCLIVSLSDCARRAKTWVLAGQGAIVFEGSSTKAELLAACSLHCAFAEYIGERIPFLDLWSLQEASFSDG